MNKTLLTGAVFAMILNGCASLQHDRLAAGDALDNFCLTSVVVHCVDVKVAGGVITGIADIGVSTPNHFILWKVSPLIAPYTFAANGIEFKTGTSVPPNEFRCKVAAGSKLFFCIDRNSTPGTYPYTVTLDQNSGGPQLKLDPKIVNN